MEQEYFCLPSPWCLALLCVWGLAYLPCDRNHSSKKSIPILLNFISFNVFQFELKFKSSIWEAFNKLLAACNVFCRQQQQILDISRLKNSLLFNFFRFHRKLTFSYYCIECLRKSVRPGFVSFCNWFLLLNLTFLVYVTNEEEIHWIDGQTLSEIVLNQILRFIYVYIFQLNLLVWIELYRYAVFVYQKQINGCFNSTFFICLNKIV